MRAMDLNAEIGVINTNDTINDYEFYYKLYVLNQHFDFEYRVS
ncbi:MAG: hypothetical protein ACOC0C_00355 [Bacteroidota bacterium]